MYSLFFNRFFLGTRESSRQIQNKKLFAKRIKNEREQEEKEHKKVVFGNSGMSIK